MRVERRRKKPRESEKKLNEYDIVVYPKRIIERILCQIVGRFTRRSLVEENRWISAEMNDKHIRLEFLTVLIDERIRP